MPAWPAVFVAGVGMFAGFGYALDGYVKRFSMRVAPGHDSNTRTCPTTRIDQVDAVARAEFAKIKAALKADRERPRARRDRAGAAELVLQGLGHELRPRPR
jgi:hypothetical protein